jgi:amino-acid N-acetyltransferase
MATPTNARQAAEAFDEKEFYLEEFRGHSVLIAMSPSAVAGHADLTPLARAAADLVRNDTRVLLWWPAAGAPAERRLRGALRRAKGLGRRRPPIALPFVRVDGTTSDLAALRADLWAGLRRERLAVVLADGADDFPRPAVVLAGALGVRKLVLLDPAGGLSRLSFAEASVLETLLHQGEAEWSGLGDRRTLVVGVRDALERGVESVNLCAPEAVGEELFTYAGSGTLFTRRDYCHVGPLALDDFAKAERLLERGQREGLLKLRSSEEIARVLAVAYGATICDRHLAGVAGLLTSPYAADRAGEIVGLYTITRFKGEGIGERLVSRLLSDGASAGLRYVFACAVDERAKAFFARLGFVAVDPDAVPAAKWAGYDDRRRARVAIFKRALAAAS